MAYANPPKEHQFSKENQPEKRGRTKGVPNSRTRLERLLTLVQKVKNPVTGELEEFSIAEQIDMKVIAKALKGDIKAYKELMDRLEGKPRQEIDQKTDHAGSITIEWVEPEL